jgi:flagellar motor switch protein FliN
MSEKWLDDEELNSLLSEGENLKDVEGDWVSELIEDGDTEDNVIASNKEEVETRPVKFEEITEENYSDNKKADFDLLMDIPLEVRVLLGSVDKTLEEIIDMHEGSVVQMDQLAGEPVEIVVGDQVVAKGETVIIDDKFGVLITEIVPPRERIRIVENKMKKQKQ